MLRRCIIPALPHLSRPPLAAVAKDDEHVYSFRTSRSLRVWPSLSLSLSISLFHHFYSSFQQIQTVMDCFDDKSCIGRCRHLVCLDAATTSSASNGCPWSYSLSINTTQGKPLFKLMTCMFCQLKQMRKKTHHYWPHPPQSCIAFLLSFFFVPSPSLLRIATSIVFCVGREICSFFFLSLADDEYHPSEDEIQESWQIVRFESCR